VIGRNLVVAYGLLGAAVFVDDGSLGPVSLPLVIATCVLVAHSIAVAPRRVVRLGVAEAVAVVLALDAVFIWIKPPAVYLQDGAVAARAIMTATALAAAWAAITSRRVSGWRALVLLVLAGVAGLLVIAGSPTPKIDVFTLQQEGARDLWRGLDPYSSVFSNPYGPEETLVFYGAPHTALSHYPYPPMSLLFSAAGWRLTGDVRHAFLVAQLATGAGLYVLARRHVAQSGIALAVAGLFLVHPRGLFVVEQAWTEPLLCAAFVWSLVLLDARGARRLVLIAALAILFAGKQYGVLLVPVFLAPRLFGKRVTVGLALVAAAAIALPFVLWDREGFFSGVVSLHVHQPFRWDSLSIAPLIAFATGWKPSLLGPVAAVAAMAWSWRRVTPGRHGLCLVASAMLLAFFVTAKQAFCNYYYFTGVVILCAAITADRVIRTR
jgi:hypothetical protein